jgi:hypothetical protein
MFGSKYKKIFAVILGISLVSSSCIKRVDNFSEEGYDARQAMRSTVKIMATVTGHKVNIVQKPDSDEFIEEDGGVEKISWSGSGVVVENDSDRNESLILSAAHVTTIGEKKSLHFEEDLHFFVPESISLTVETLDGTKCIAEPLIANEKADVSAVISKCIAGTPARMAKELPPVGAFVMVSGAALGFHPPGIFIVTDGRYMGINVETNEEVLTLPIVGGHSGSAVFYKGEIFGIVSKRMVRFEHTSLCVSLDTTKELLNIASKMWAMIKG